MSKHPTAEICPICLETFLQHVHCSHASCTFLVTTCPKCDKEQAVRAFVLDHEKDCAAGEVAQPVPSRRAA